MLNFTVVVLFFVKANDKVNITCSKALLVIVRKQGDRKIRRGSLTSCVIVV